MNQFVLGGNWKMQIIKVEEAVLIAKEIAQALDDITLKTLMFLSHLHTMRFIQLDKQLKEVNLNWQGRICIFAIKAHLQGKFPQIH